MIRVLKDSVVFGVYTNIPYLIEILNHSEFVSGAMTTRFIVNNFAESLKEPALSPEEKQIVENEMRKSRGQASGPSMLTNSPWDSFWRGI